MRAVTALIAGLAFALLIVGVALYPLLSPAFTRLLEQRYGEVSMAGLSQEQMLSTAEQVRAFVAGEGGDTLPAQVDGRSGFDEAAVSHLRDVRDVLGGARVFTGVLAALVVVWLGIETVRKHFATISSALLVGAAFCALFVVLGVLAGTVDFDAFFRWFHGLFFTAGTWEFPADSLLIELFPEMFWTMAGAAWAGVVTLGGVVLGLAGWFVRTTEVHGRRAAGRRLT